MIYLIRTRDKGKEREKNKDVSNMERQKMRIMLVI